MDFKQVSPEISTLPRNKDKHIHNRQGFWYHMERGLQTRSEKGFYSHGIALAAADCNHLDTEW